MDTVNKLRWKDATIEPPQVGKEYLVFFLQGTEVMRVQRYEHCVITRMTFSGGAKVHPCSADDNDPNKEYVDCFVTKAGTLSKAIYYMDLPEPPKEFQKVWALKQQINELENEIRKLEGQE